MSLHRPGVLPHGPAGGPRAAVPSSQPLYAVLHASKVLTLTLPGK